MIPIYSPSLTKIERKHLINAFDSGWISSKGEYIQRFEKSVGKFIGRKRSISTCNGTSALHLSLLALGIGQGDEVVVPNLTFAATINVVLYLGARPVIVDVEDQNWGIEPMLLRKAITKKTKAIIVVHLYGQPSKIREIKEIAEANGIPLIEDCAESIGSTYDGKRTGSFGEISCFSFYGNKVVTTGEGGMCLTNNDEIADMIEVLRDHGMEKSRRYWHSIVGYNYRMTNLSAAIGFAQMERIDELISKKRFIADFYFRNLSEEIEKQVDPPGGLSIFWLYSIILKSEGQRNEIIRGLQCEGIDTRPFFFPLTEMPPYLKYRKVLLSSGGSLNLSKCGLNLPSYPELTSSQLQFIVDKFNDVLFQRG